MGMLLAQAAPPVIGNGPGVLRSIAAVVIVFGLLALCVWLVRRGGLEAFGRRGPRAVQVETAVPLGDRRQLIVVNVEGRRLLLGLTNAQVNLITELTAAPSFNAALEARLDDAGQAPS